MRYVITLAFVLLFASACKKDGLPYKNEYDVSYKKWLRFKNETNNNYTYTVYFQSMIGFYSETKLTISSGIVVNRSYNSGSIAQGTGSFIVTESWIEAGATVNTHQEGAPAINLDDIYEKARTEYLTVDKIKNSIYFRTENNGLISAAGYVPKNCADDCFNGVHIKEIKAVTFVP